jgi:hypothetical protein
MKNYFYVFGRQMARNVNETMLRRLWEKTVYSVERTAGGFQEKKKKPSFDLGHRRQIKIVSFLLSCVFKKLSQQMSAKHQDCVPQFGFHGIATHFKRIPY